MRKFLSGATDKRLTLEVPPTKPNRSLSNTSDRADPKQRNSGSYRKSRITGTHVQVSNPNVHYEAIIIHNHDKVALLERYIQHRPSLQQLLSSSIMHSNTVVWAEEAAVPTVAVHLWPISVQYIVESSLGKELLRIFMSTLHSSVFLEFYENILNFEKAPLIEIPSRARKIVETFVQKVEPSRKCLSVEDEQSLFASLLDVFTGRLTLLDGRSMFSKVKEKLVDYFNTQHLKAFCDGYLYRAAESVLTHKITAHQSSTLLPEEQEQKQDHFQQMQSEEQHADFSDELTTARLDPDPKHQSQDVDINDGDIVATKSTIIADPIDIDMRSAERIADTFSSNDLHDSHGAILNPSMSPLSTESDVLLQEESRNALTNDDMHGEYAFKILPSTVQPPHPPNEETIMDSITNMSVNNLGSADAHENSEQSSSAIDRERIEQMGNDPAFRHGNEPKATVSNQNQIYLTMSEDCAKPHSQDVSRESTLAEHADESRDSDSSSDEFSILCDHDREEWSSSLDELLQSVKGCLFFTSFLKSENAEGNIRFLHEVDHFGEISNSAQRRIEAAKIIDNFFIASAVHQTCMTQPTKDTVMRFHEYQRGSEGQVYESLFDEARKEVYEFLGGDAYTRFLQSGLVSSLQRNTLAQTTVDESKATDDEFANMEDRFDGSRLRRSGTLFATSPTSTQDEKVLHKRRTSAVHGLPGGLMPMSREELTKLKELQRQERQRKELQNQASASEKEEIKKDKTEMRPPSISGPARLTGSGKRQAFVWKNTITVNVPQTESAIETDQEVLEAKVSTTPSTPLSALVNFWSTLEKSKPSAPANAEQNQTSVRRRVETMGARSPAMWTGKEAKSPPTPMALQSSEQANPKK